MKEPGTKTLKRAEFLAEGEKAKLHIVKFSQDLVCASCLTHQHGWCSVLLQYQQRELLIALSLIHI